MEKGFKPVVVYMGTLLGTGFLIWVQSCFSRSNLYIFACLKAFLFIGFEVSIIILNIR